MRCGSRGPVRTSMIVAVTAAVVLVGAAVATGEPPLTTRIPHRDGSGRATIVEVDPGVPGARRFVRDDEDRPAPKPGELSLPSRTPRADRTPAPSATR